MTLILKGSVAKLTFISYPRLSDDLSFLKRVIQYAAALGNSGQFDICEHANMDDTTKDRLLTNS